MAKRPPASSPAEPFEENIIDVDVASEMQGSFLEDRKSTRLKLQSH